MKRSRSLFLLCVLCLITFLLVVISITTGSVSLSVEQIFQSLMNPNTNSISENILWQIRLPRSLAALMAGACLALSGLEMQTLFRNPLAGPYSMGISSGSMLGVALAVMAGTAMEQMGFPSWTHLQGLWSTLGMAGSAIVGAALVMAIVLILSQKIRSNTTLLILGLMFGQMAGAVVSLLQSFSDAEKIRAFTFWSFGSYSNVTWEQMPVLAIALLIGFGLAIYSAKQLNALLLGWTYAKSMGIQVSRLRILLLLSSSVLTGAVTAFCGPIGFLGLAVPHLCRGLFRTSDHRILIPACFFLGAAVSLISDLATRLPGHGRTLPLNAITALVGGPVVIWVLLRSRKGSLKGQHD